MLGKICALIMLVVSGFFLSFDAVAAEKQQAAEDELSPYEAGRLRALYTGELNDQRNYANWIDSLIRALRGLQDTVKALSADAEKENSEVLDIARGWIRTAESESSSSAIEQASATAIARFRRSPRSGGGFGVYDTSKWLSFSNFVRNGTGHLTQGDIQSFVSAIFVPNLDTNFRAAYDQSNSAVQAIQDKRQHDPCADYYSLLSAPPPPPVGTQATGDNELKQKARACVDDASARTDFSRSYYAAMSSGIGKLVEVLSTSVGAVRTEIQTLTQKLNDLSQREARADKEYRSKERTVIDQSALWIIIITLVAWMLIIGMVIGAIMYMGRGGGQATAGVGGFSAQPFNYVLFLEMMTVFILTATILILGLGGKLQNEALAALIGGISGYVLGRIHSSNRQPA